MDKNKHLVWLGRFRTFSLFRLPLIWLKSFYAKLEHFRFRVFLSRDWVDKSSAMTNLRFICIAQVTMNHLIFIVLLLVQVLAQNVEEKFRSSKIVDDILAKPPDSPLEVVFDCGVTTLGNQFTPLQVRNRPKIEWKRAKENEFYTLIMIDAAGKNQERLHWLVVNIPEMNLDKGDELASFFPSAPPKNSGEHRYVFLLFKQPGKIDVQGHVKMSTFQMDGREKFSTKNFAETYKLETPVAGNFYLASFDDSCNEMFKLVEEYEKKKN